jgi:transcriptional regulator with XRE-family HTH domain
LLVLRAREARGWSQERAAHELGIGVRTLRDIEAGRARMTALEALIDLGSIPALATEVVSQRTLFLASNTERPTVAPEQREVSHRGAGKRRAA